MLIAIVVVLLLTWHVSCLHVGSDVVSSRPQPVRIILVIVCSATSPPTMDSSPVVNAMVPVVTDRVSAAVETGMVSAAVDPLQRVIDVTDRVLAAIPVVDRSISCWDKLSRPILGLMDAEQVLHGGALHGPVLLNG